MAKVYRTVGSLALILNELRRKKVPGIKSLDEILTLRDKSDNMILGLKEAAKKTVTSKIEILKQEISDSSDQYDRISIEVQHMSSKKIGNPFKKLSNTFTRRQLENNLKQLDRSIADARKELIYLKGNTDRVIEETSSSSAKKIPIIKSIIEDNSFLISGAIGEEKAVDELKKLPDSYHVINDFKYEFPRAIHRRKEDDWIKSIQADHIVIGPPGVFVVETKNWSSESIQSPDLFSPVEQIRRHSFALFILLNNAISPSSSFKLLRGSFKHHWGIQEIAVRNILLMVNAKPNQKFQYVKICAIDDLRAYITYFDPILKSDQAQKLADFLLYICKGN